MADTPTVQMDQVADAIIAAPSEGVRALTLNGTITDTTTSLTWVDIAGASGTFNNSFAGKFLCQLHGQCRVTVGAGAVLFRVVIDAGTGDEVIISDGGWKIVGTVTDHLNFGAGVLADLPVTGQHTIKLQWQVTSGVTGAIDANNVFHVDLILLSGSGAGGVLADEVQRTGDYTEARPLTPDTYHDVDLDVNDPSTVPFEVTFSTHEGEDVLILLNGHLFAATHGSSGNDFADFRLYLDGTTGIQNIRQKFGDIPASHDAGFTLIGLAQGLSAGSHSVKMQFRKNPGAVALTLRFLNTLRMRALRFRGGHTPIEDADGVVNATPQALVFPGAGHSVSTGTGLDIGKAIIELNDAITAPGDVIEMLNVSNVAITITNSSFEDATGVTGVFTALADGTYDLTFLTSVWFSGGSTATQVHYQLVFDAGESFEQTIGDDDITWGMRRNTDTDHGHRTMSASVALTEGSHTVKVQWRRSTGDRTPTAGSGVNYFKLTGSLSTGSGAGGVLVDQFILGADFDTVSATFVPVTDSSQGGAEMSITVDVAEGERVQFGGVLNPNFTGGTVAGSARIGIGIDGSDPTTPLQWVQTSGPVSDFRNQNISGLGIFSPALSAGSHTFRIMVRRAVGDGTFRVPGGSGDNRSSTFQVIRHRGGLVPVRQDGAGVIDKPAAFDFVGAQVTNVSGTAKVSLLGAEGVIKTAADVTGVSITTDDPSWQDVSQFTIEGGEGEEVFLTLSTQARSDSAALAGMQVRIYDDTASVAVATTMESSDTTDRYRSHAISSSYALPASGSRVFKLQANRFIGSVTWVLNRAQFQCQQYRGGYTQKENQPVIDESSYSGQTVDYINALGASTTLRLVLNDGIRRTAVSPLSIDLTVSGIGGIETSDFPSVNDTWYAVYAVPTVADDSVFDLVATSNDPLTTPPTDWPVYKYLGSLRNDTAVLRIGKQVGAKVKWQLPEQVYTDSAASPDGSPVSTSLAAAVPTSAIAADLRSLMSSAAADASRYVLDLMPISGIIHALNSCTTIGATNDDNGNIYVADFPLFATQNMYRELRRTTGAGTLSFVDLRVSGYTDGLLLGAPQAQTQAKFTPDTASAMGTWASGTTVNFTARQAQPSTVRITLQDGKQRYFSGTLNWDHANGVADLGYDDAGSAAAGDKWIYFYAVPKSGADDELTIRASDNPFSTGPTGYTDFKMIYKSRRVSAALLDIRQKGNVFGYLAFPNVAGGEGWGTTPQDPAITVTMSTYLPDGVLIATLVGNIRSSATGTGAEILQAVTEVGTAFSSLGGRTIQIVTENQVQIAGQVSVIAANQISYRSAIVSGTGTIVSQGLWVKSWIDGDVDP
jgi:hypothetical protein